MMRGEIMHEAIRGLMEPERRLERFDGAIALGMADAKAGRVQDIEAVRRELRDAAAESPLTA
jgi:antitoxin ParD1/3/4